MRRNLSRFSLRALLVVVTAIAAVLGWIRYEVARVESEWRAEQGVRERLDAMGVRTDYALCAGPSWLRSFHRQDAVFRRTTEVNIASSCVSVHDDSLLAELKRLPYLKRVNYTHVANNISAAIAGPVTQQDVQHLRQELPHVEVSGWTFDP